MHSFLIFWFKCAKNVTRLPSLPLMFLSSDPISSFTNQVPSLSGFASVATNVFLYTSASLTAAPPLLCHQMALLVKRMVRLDCVSFWLSQVIHLPSVLMCSSCFSSKVPSGFCGPAWTFFAWKPNVHISFSRIVCRSNVCFIAAKWTHNEIWCHTGLMFLVEMSDWFTSVAWNEHLNNQWYQSNFPSLVSL